MYKESTALNIETANEKEEVELKSFDIKRVEELKKLLVNISKRKKILIVTHDDRLKDISFATFTISNNEVKEIDNTLVFNQNKAVFVNNKSLLELKAKNKFLKFNKLNVFVFLIYIFIIVSVKCTT